MLIVAVVVTVCGDGLHFTEHLNQMYPVITSKYSFGVSETKGTFSGNAEHLVENDVMHIWARDRQSFTSASTPSTTSII